MGLSMEKIVAIFLLMAAGILTGQTRYTLSCPLELLTESRIILLEQENVLEQGNNSGPEIDAYLSSVSLSPGQPYCAAGQYWCFLTACRQLGMSSDYIPMPNSGLATASFRHAGQYGIRTAYRASVDDLIVWRRGNSAFGHVERIVKICSGGWVETIAFNSDRTIDGIKREGVFRMKRNIYSHYGRLRLIGLCGFTAEVRYDS